MSNFFVSSDTEAVLNEIEIERSNQDEKWGEQNHSDSAGVSWRRNFFLNAEDWKVRNTDRVASKTLTWDGILLEEVFEALAESDPQKLREELIQVAAVAVAWVEAIDRRTNQ